MKVEEVDTRAQARVNLTLAVANLALQATTRWPESSSRMEPVTSRLYKVITENFGIWSSRERLYQTRVLVNGLRDQPGDDPLDFRIRLSLLADLIAGKVLGEIPF
jgi:hypothetical protein